MGIEKNIFTLWFQGWHDAPRITTFCVDSWKKLNPDWKIHCITMDNLENYIEFDKTTVQILFNNQYIINQTKSVFIRLKLLEKFGGVWTDPTVLCLKPMDQWLCNELQNGFFAFDFSNPDIHAMSNWFIAAKRNNDIIQKITKLFTARLKALQKKIDISNPKEYFIFHQEFDRLLQIDPFTRATWNTLNHDMSKYVNAFNLNYKCTQPFIKKAIMAETPMLKLTHRLFDPFKVKSIQYLLNHIDNITN